MDMGLIALQKLEEIKERVEDESYKISSSQAYESLRKAVNHLEELEDMRLQGQAQQVVLRMIYHIHDNLVRGN